MSRISASAISGSLSALFLYDVSEEIRLEQLRGILGTPPPGREPSFRQPAPEYVQFARPPVIEPLKAPVFGAAGPFSGQVAYYDYGVISLKLEMPFQGSWEEAVDLAARWMNAPELDQQAAEAMRWHLKRAASALFKPYQDQLSEDYFIFYLRNIPDENGLPLTATRLLNEYGHFIAQIVRGERANFSAAEEMEILASRMSYYETDLAIVGWSAALIYDTPEGVAPTMQLLEYANTQLLEFRHYDAVLTNLLTEVYRTLEKGAGIRRRWRLAREASRLNTIRLDVRELAEHVDNSIKFLSDMFAARFYRMAAARIGVRDYRSLVDHKLDSAGDLYGFMMDQFHQGRAFILELMIVVILVIELIFLFRGKA